MEKEYIKETNRSVTLNVTGGKIDSFRELEKTTGTVRVYDNGMIGVAGCLGEPNENALTEKAKEALSFGIPYPWRPDAPLALEDIREEEILSVPDFIPRMQSFLDRLGALCPKFAFSHKLRLEHNRAEYRSSAGRRLLSAGRAISIELVAQNRGSGNLFDTFFGWGGTKFDEDALLAWIKEQYDAFYRPADLEPGRYPVVAGTETFFETFSRHFVGDLYASGASLLSGKLNEKVFSEKLSLRDDRNPITFPGSRFFDAEGCTAPDFRPTVIEKGVLTGLLTTKKTADQFGLPNLGTAGAPYDGVPGIGFSRYWLDPTAKSLKELVPGKAVYVVVAAGGDITPDGRYATPVQMAYLMENGTLVGRLPDLTINGNVFEMFGKDYVGAVHNDPIDSSILGAVVMDVEKA
ncbi:MAG: hypothetical protein J5789_02560 [Oscillospiraceae bacterium]|nr:hypothetical protein [Oscillospiraceae bacterium]